MAFELALPADLKKSRWKVKIRDKEVREPPHVTIIHGTKAWRIDLRTKAFMDKKPPPAEVPEKLTAHIRKAENWKALCDAWDRMYPGNPVQSEAQGSESDDDKN